VERTRLTLWVIIVAAGALLAACGGGASPVGLLSSGSPLPELQPAAAIIGAKPHALTFGGVGKTFAKKVVISEKSYAGKFVEHSTCKGVAKASPLSGNGPKLTVKVTPLKNGTCTITFEDAKKHKAKVPITVGGAGPTPTPSTSPTGSPTTKPSSSPTTGPTGPTPTPGAAAAIFVTYTASTAHPNVVAYDEQGNIKSTGSWGGAGVNPQSIVWAPGDEAWFYLTNGTTNTVKVYSSGGSQLSFCGSVTNAGAIAYPWGLSNILYVASPSAHTIVAYSTHCAVLSPSFPTNIDTTLGGLTYDTNMSRIYVSNTSSGKVEYYGNTTGTLGSSISAPCTCSPGAIAFDSANNHIYVWWNGTGGRISAYDESGGAVTLTGGSGTPFAGLSAPQAIAVDTNNGYLYITDGTSVKVFDATGSTITTSGTFNPGFTATSANGITVNPP
jgi:hypothetical protein